MKKIIALFIAAAFVVGFSAFTAGNSGNQKKLDGELWFELVANGNPNDPEDYFLVGGTGTTEPSCVLTTGYRCAIKTQMQGEDDEHPGYPVLTGFIAERKRNTP